MRPLKIGIMPSKQFQKHLLSIASGDSIIQKNAPKIWFNSIESLSKVLSENNVRLLKLIEKYHPETLRELADLSGRKSSNLSRTLKTMERYGIVELKKKNKAVQPIAKATQFTIQYAL